MLAALLTLVNSTPYLISAQIFDIGDAKVNLSGQQMSGRNGVMTCIGVTDKCLASIAALAASHTIGVVAEPKIKVLPGSPAEIRIGGMNGTPAQLKTLLTEQMGTLQLSGEFVRDLGPTDRADATFNFNPVGGRTDAVQIKTKSGHKFLITITVAASPSSPATTGS